MWVWLRIPNGPLVLAFTYIDSAMGPSAKGARVNDSPTADDVRRVLELPDQTFRSPRSFGERSLSAAEIARLGLPPSPPWLERIETAPAPLLAPIEFTTKGARDRWEELHVKRDVRLANDGGASWRADVEKLLSRPEATHLRALSFDEPVRITEGDWAFTPAISACAVVGLPTSLRSLAFTSNFVDRFSVAGDLTPLSRFLGTLERLELGSGVFTFGDGGYDVLQELVTRHRWNAAGILDASRMTSLRSLDLVASLWSPGDWSTMAPLFERRGFSSLVHLTWRNAELPLVRALTTSALLRGLRALSLHGSELGDATAEHVLSRRASYAHLERVELHDHRLSDAVAKQLVAALPQVVVGDAHRPNPGNPWDDRD